VDGVFRTEGGAAITAVHGPRGGGKTNLAAAYAQAWPLLERALAILVKGFGSEHQNEH
jgi:hypothetical protein